MRKTNQIEEHKNEPRHASTLGNRKAKSEIEKQEARHKKANIKRVFDNAQRQGHDRKKLVYINSGGLIDYFYHKETKKEIKIKNVSFNNTGRL